MTATFGSFFGKRLLAGFVLAAFAPVPGSDAMNAAAQNSPAIAITCSGSAQVPATHLAGLCDDLRDALANTHPRARFLVVPSSPSPVAPFVALYALSASKTGIEARLTWQAPGRNAVLGPASGVSVTDQDLTPAMRVQFLNHLVADAALPF